MPLSPLQIETAPIGTLSPTTATFVTSRDFVTTFYIFSIYSYQEYEFASQDDFYMPGPILYNALSFFWVLTIMFMAVTDPFSEVFSLLPTNSLYELFVKNAPHFVF